VLLIKSHEFKPDLLAASAPAASCSPATATSATRAPASSAPTGSPVLARNNQAETADRRSESFAEAMRRHCMLEGLAEKGSSVHRYFLLGQSLTENY
jgi:hypothetical protein